MCMNVYVCVLCACFCMGVLAHICAHRHAKGRGQKYLLNLCVSFFETVPLSEPGAHQASELAGKQAPRIFLSLFPGAEITDVCPVTLLFF